MEVWKSLDFLGYPDYEVSNFGKVKSLKRNEKILNQGKHKRGYLIVVLSKDNKRKTFTVHRLVCLAFLENPENLPMINHKNEIKTDNHVDNLEFCTAKHNSNYGTCKERMSKSLRGRKLSEETKNKISENNPNRKPILQYTKDNIFIRNWDSAKSASQELKICATSITACCKGKRKSSGGFLWKYKN